MTAPVSILPDTRIRSALHQAARATGTDFDYLLRTAQRESAFKTDAKSKTSSATGLFQFIEETWLATLKSVGGAFGLGKFANAIERTADGRHKVPDRAMRKEILALRKDPKTSALMAGVYTRQSANTLEGRLGRKPVAGELYMAHFLGASGAGKLIDAAENRPNVSAAKLFPAAAAANRSIFYNKSGAPRTVKAVYQNLLSKHGQRKVAFASSAKSAQAVVHPAAASGSAAEVSSNVARANKRPLLQRLFISGVGGVSASAGDTIRMWPGFSAAHLKVLAAAKPAENRSDAPAEAEKTQTDPVSDGLLGRRRLRGLNGTLTYELFRTAGLRGSV